MATMAEKELTHDEVWDDSALVASWDEALEEYKKYHSLAAKGEKVPKVEVPLEVPAKAAAIQKQHTTKPQPPKQAQAQAQSQTKSKQPLTTAPIPPNFIGPELPPSETKSSASSAAPSLPQALLSSTQDENLRNIMMSWYYAGYHTGLYEGQQRAWAQWQEAQQQQQEQDKEATG